MKYQAYASCRLATKNQNKLIRVRNPVITRGELRLKTNQLDHEEIRDSARQLLRPWLLPNRENNVQPSHEKKQRMYKRLLSPFPNDDLFVKHFPKGE